MLLDVANPRKQEARATALTVVNDDSLGDQIQRAFPDARVVKALYTVNCQVMVRPAFAPSERIVFVGGEDAAANDIVAALLGGFGWPSERTIDLGGNAAATQPRRSCPWRCRRSALGGLHFNVALPPAPSAGSA